MRTYVVVASGVVVLAVASLIACSGSNPTSGFGSSGGSGSGTSSGSSGSASGSSSGSGASSGSTNFGSSNGGGSSGGNTIDGGFVCAPNPLNYDIPGNNCDDDGDGKVDNRVTCDTGGVPSGLSGAGSAADFAAAIELCQMADATHWGVVSAVYTNGHSQTGPGPDQFEQQHGVLQTFGSVVVPREGGSFGALSSGSATALDSDYVANGTSPQSTTGAFKGGKNGMQNAPGCSTNPLSCIGGAAGNSGDVPSGFPKAAAGCPGNSTVNDVIDVKLKIKVPANANGVTFDFDFFSGEWPEYVCTDYNDSFIAYLQSAAFNSGNADNISFDSKGNAVSVNNGFFGVCTPNVQTGCSGNTTGTSVCSAGPAALAGTGFDNENKWCSSQSTGGGATGWLTSAAPAKAGETISLEFIIWDTGDWNYDSSVLVDNLSWQPQVISTPITQPSPPIK